VRLSVAEAREGEVLFEVKDTGKGVAEEDLPHLLRASTEPTSPGTTTPSKAAASALLLPSTT
jgi:signal transduction histidine kinase